MINILIADDHEIFRQGLKILLISSNDPEIAIVGEVSNGKDASSFIEKERPDVAILDISMLEMNGLEVAKEAYKKGLETKIIILTMHKDPIMVKKALQYGVCGYVLKDNAIDDLLFAIRSTTIGGKFISPSISDKLFSPQNNKNIDNTKKDITNREKEVLKLITKGFTNKLIAEKLFISRKTVETHRARIMSKLDIHNVAGLIKYAISTGLS